MAKERLFEKRPKYRYVYFVNQVRTNYFKIGIAEDVELRLSSLQTGNPYALIIYACQNFDYDEAATVEAALHQEFRLWRVRGEWFEFENRDLKDAIRIMRNYYSKNGDYKRTPEIFP